MPDVGMWTCPQQVSVALTLSGWADYAHPIVLVSTSFESHRCSWHMMEACFNLKQTQSKNFVSNALEFETKTLGSWFLVLVLYG